MRRTKIIATLGPATDKPDILEKLINAGVDVFRLNYSHQTHEHHENRMKEIRRLSSKPCQIRHLDLARPAQSRAASAALV